MQVRQAVIVEPFKVDVRTVDLPEPADNQVLVECHASAISPGTELAVYTGSHQWLKDPKMVDWKFPFKSGYSAAGVVKAVGKSVTGWKVGDRVSYPGNHASHELLTFGHERGRLWKMRDDLPFEKAAMACILRYGMGGSIRAGITLGKSFAVLGLGMIGQSALRCAMAAGAFPVVGIDSVKMRREAALAAGAELVLDPTDETLQDEAGRLPRRQGGGDRRRLHRRPRCGAGRDVAGGRRRHGHGRRQSARQGPERQLLRRPPSPLHRRRRRSRQHALRAGPYPAAGAWSIDKAQRWLLGNLAAERISLKGLVRHTIVPEQLGEAYEGLLKKKEEYLAVVMKWK